MGYLPEALRNYLVRLGWSHGDQEIFSPEEMIAAFDLPAIGRAPARFDFAKLESINGHYIRSSNDNDILEKLEDALPYLADGPALAERLTPELRGKLLTAMPALKERAKTLLDLLDGSRFLWAARPLELDDKAKALLTPEARQMIGALLRDLSALTTWTTASTEEAIRSFAERAQVKLGSVAQPVRAALTGRTTSPGIFDVLDVLGREESIGRLRDQVRTET
jgi:glutamyl-tRNA synthetase